jgi:hypothetical protein
MTIVPSTLLYRERVLPSMMFFIVMLTLPISLFLVALPFSEVASIVLAITSIPVVLVLSWIASPKIELTQGQFTVGNVRIDKSLLGRAEVITSSNTFQERGVLLDSRAFTRFQIGIKELVKIAINDEVDPTPYWLISSRNAEVLAGLINKR